MKIRELYIRDFGKISDRKIVFEDGLNVVTENNGYGKTTTAAFIAAMFYGFTYSRKGGVSDAQTYCPWNGTGKFGGSLTFEEKGTLYRIERSFGLTAKSEECALFDVRSGKALPAENIGERFFGLSASSFTQSFYLPQAAVTVGANEDFRQKLSGAAAGESGDNNADGALQKLSELAKYYVKTGGRGKIAETERNVFDTEREIEKCRRNAEKAEEKRAELAALRQKRGKLSEELRHTEEQRAAVAKAQPDEQQRQQRKKLEEAKRYLTENNFPALSEDKDEAARWMAKETKMPKYFLPLTVVALLLTAFGAVAAFLLSPYCAVASVVGVAVGIVAFVLARKQVGEAERAKGKRLAEIFAKYGIENEDVDASYRALAAKKEEYEQKKWTYTVLAGDVSDDGAEEKERERLLQLTSQKEALQRDISDADYLLGSLEREAQSLTEAADATEYVDRLQNEKALLEQMRRDYAAVIKTAELIGAAKEKAATAYLPKLAERSAELFRFAKNGAETFTVDGQFSVLLTEKGVTKDVNLFSQGTKDLAAFCFRVALSEMLFDGKLPFLLIDDAFVNLDEEAFDGCAKLLSALSKDTQVVYFSCHERANRIRPSRRFV